MNFLRLSAFFLGLWVLCAGVTAMAGDSFLVTSEELGQLDAEAATGGVEQKLLAGELHELKASSESDPKMAAKWYAEASALGSGRADMLLGYLYETGKGVKQSYEEARLCYERAVERGLVEANFRLGLLYLEGWGVEQDRAKMRRLVTLAAESGFVPAMKVLSELYMGGIGGGRDMDAALEWAKRAAFAKEDAKSDTLVGRAYWLKSRRDEINLVAAREWYGLAAEQDYTQAMVEMARTFKRRGTGQDLEMAREWLILAAEGGNGSAAYMLAAIEFDYAKKMEDPGAVERAREWLEMAAKLKSMQARMVLLKEKDGLSLDKAFEYTQQQVMKAWQGQTALAPEMGDPVKQAPTSGDHVPKPWRLVTPKYPEGLRLSGQSGLVRVAFIIRSDGSVRHVRVLESTHPAFEENAIEAVSQWTFIPAVKDGRPVNTRVQQELKFHPDGPAAAEAEKKKRQGK